MQPVEIALVLFVPVSFLLMLAIERFIKAREFPDVPGWHWVGWGVFIFSGVVNATLPEALPMEWLRAHRLLDLAAWPLWQQCVAGYLVIMFCTYWWHRVTHRFDLLWRAFHQLHHAPRHLNIYAANLFHPLDLALYVLLPALIGFFVLGLDALAVLILGSLGALVAFVQHWNVRTPAWLVLLMQRPEAHCVHHQRGLHAFNYSDLPLWDWLFGTYLSPATWNGATGFAEPADTRYAAMLGFADANAAELGAARRAQETQPASR